MICIEEKQILFKGLVGPKIHQPLNPIYIYAYMCVDTRQYAYVSGKKKLFMIIKKGFKLKNNPRYPLGYSNFFPSTG